MRLAQILVGMVLFGMGCGEAWSQTRLYSSYTKADGLPSDYVMRMVQTPGGFMWFGTERGAAVYDGQTFTTYTTEDGLPHNLVYDILEDAQGRTWFATPLPVLSYLKHGKIQVFSDSIGTTYPVGTIAMDRNNRVFFRHLDGIGVVNGDDYQFHRVAMSLSKESNLERLADGRVALSDGNHVLAIRLDSGTDLRFDTLLTLPMFNGFTVMQQAADSTIYVTKNRGVARYRLVGNRLEELEYHAIGFYTSMSVLNGGTSPRLVLGSRNTGIKLFSEGRLTQVITSAGSDRNFVSGQLVDYEGTLWVSYFGQGVEKITTWNALVMNEESGLPERNVWRVATHNGDILAMGVAGIRRIRGDQVESLRDLPSTLRSVRGIHYTADKVYVATLSDLRIHEYDAKRDRIGKLIRMLDFGDGVNDIRMASDGSMWVACAGMRLFRVMPDLSVREYPVKNGAEKLVRAGDAMWILTSTDGAYRVQNDVFKPYSKSTGDLPSDAVWSVHEDADGILIGTSAGLVRITPDGSRSVYDASNGLSGFPVIGVFPTSVSRNGSQSYWVVTPNHLHQLDGSNLLKGNSLATLSEEMAGTHWVQPSEDFSTLYLGTGNGLVIYDLTRTGRDIPPPKVAIRGVSIQGVRHPSWTEGGIRHRASSSTLEFDFAGLTFIKESDTRFSYRLVGLDDDWSTPQSYRTVRYANVSPGSYEFQVRAVNIDGVVSSEVASLRIELDPPWWMHPIVVVLLILGAVGGLVAGIRWRVHQIRADIVKRNEQKQFEAIQRIGASISHDIKNTVFSLSLLAKNLEKRFDNPEFRKDAIETIESSLTYLSTLVDRLQQKPSAAEASRHDIALRGMCSDVAKRVTAGTDRRVNVDIPDTMRIRIQPEPIERILENLIRNAVEATSPGQVVNVSAQQVGPHTELFVMDEGPGMSEDFITTRLFKPFQSTKTKGLGIGLYSCKELADAMGATIDVESELGKGTTFRVRFVTSPT